MATPNHVDLSVLWVPIMPETSKFAPAMEDATKDAKTKFQAQTKDITKPIDEALTKTGTKAKETFDKIGVSAKDSLGKAGAEGGKSLSDNLAEQTSHRMTGVFSTIGSKIKGALGQAGSEGGGSLADNFQNATGKLSGYAEKLGTSVGGELSGGISDALKSIPGVDTAIDSLKKVGDAGHEVGDKISEAKGQFKQLEDLLGGFNDKADGTAGKVKNIVGELGKVAGAAGAWMALFEGFDKFGDTLSHLPGMGVLNNVLSGNWLHGDGGDEPLDQAPGPSNFWYGKNKEFWQQHPWHKGMSIHDAEAGRNGPSSSSDDPSKYADLLLGAAGSHDQASANYQPHGDPSRWGDTLGAAGDGYDAFSNGQPLPQPDKPKDTGDPASGDPSVSRWGRAAAGADSSTPGDFDWDAVAEHESHGDWSINTGNGYYGGLQFDLQTWKDFGGLDFAPRPDLATREQQITVANRVPANQRKRRWPNTYSFGMPASDNGSGSGGGASGRGGGGGGGRGSGGGSGGAGPTGSPGGSDYGASSGNPTIAPPDEKSIRSWVESNFGIPNTFGTGSWENAAHDHDGGWHHRGLGGKDVGSGYAFDFHGTSEQMSKLANWVADNYKDQTLELIYGGAGFDHNREIKNAKFGDVYGAGLNAQHRDHVHWAMTAPPGGKRGGGAGGPVGTKGDPFYTASAEPGGKSATHNEASELGSGLLDGISQSLGLDGSVFQNFAGSGPMDFGVTKLATSFLNMAGPLFGGRSGGDSGGGAAAGGDGSMLPGLAALLPGLGGAQVSAAATPTNADPVNGGAGSGDTYIHNGDNNPFAPVFNGSQGDAPDLKALHNGIAARSAPAVVPNAGGMPAGGMP